jgi:hypothetical protein
MIAKPFHIIVLCLVLTLASCKDNSITLEDSQPSLKGIIENWLPGDNKLDISVGRNGITVILDSTTVDDNGAFTIKMPFPPPPDSMLRPFVPETDSNQHFGEFDERMFSNSNAKYASLFFHVYAPHHISMGLYNGNQFLTTDSGSAIGDYHVEYIYFNQSTAISGSYRITFYDSLLIKQAGRSNFITIYNLHLSAGWNRITTVLRANDTQTRIFEVTSDSFHDTKWFAVWSMSRTFDYAKLF